MSGFIKWQPIDVTNAIAIAILMLLLGTVVSMYMSIAISRLSDFRKTRLAAMTEVSFMDRTLLGTRNYALAEIELRSALRVPAIAFRVDRQKEAAKFLEFAAGTLRTHFINRFSELAAERGVRNCEELSGDEWANVVRAACRISECELRSIAEQVYQIKPTYWRVFMIPRGIRVPNDPRIAVHVQREWRRAGQPSRGLPSASAPVREGLRSRSVCRTWRLARCGTRPVLRLGDPARLADSAE